MVAYNNLAESAKCPKGIIPIWDREVRAGKHKARDWCLLSVFCVFCAFVVGLSVGILVPLFCSRPSRPLLSETSGQNSATAAIRSVFLNNSYGFRNASQEPNGADRLGQLNRYPTVSFVDDGTELSEVISGGVYWSDGVEKALPQGFADNNHELWSSFVRNTAAVKLERGCGRMQNRLVTFQDGSQGCVRYRQNTDQIQGELFSFYLAKVLKIPNLAPSTVSVVNLKIPLWQNLANEIASAQWSTNRPVVLTKYIPNLDNSNIPNVFRPIERHLNKNDVQNLTISNSNHLKSLVELAQWSDLIIFDYLTANLDRIVNNLYNYQWNSNIMEAPAHNLAKKVDSDLLIFLDNESGLLHGYRLLDKYEIYHTILLDNLCIFRKQTADIIKRLKSDGDVGDILRGMFDSSNGKHVRDVLPTLPDKSVKILNARIDKVYNQITKCEAMFAAT